MSKLLLENRTLREKLLKNECHSRRDNLVFIGVAEQKGESCDAIILDILNSAGYDLDLRAVARAHRVGPYNKHCIRPIVAKFHHYRDRENVWEGRRYVEESCGVTVAEDFPEEIRERRKRLYPILNAAISYRDEDYPDFRFRARLSVDKLIINGSSYTVDTLCKLPERLRLDKTLSPVKDNAQVFFTSASPLSNHYACNFTVGGTRYSSLEQYLMEQKALHFDDRDTAAAIMEIPNLVHQKRLGKSVKNFDLFVWQGEVSDILKTGLEAKFNQAKHCGDFLRSTQNRTLGEANANDNFYGIGMGLQDPNVWDQGRWGKNLLGKLLMEVRDSL